MIKSDALFSDCKRYRYTLVRQWSHGPKSIAFIGLNPSTADEIKNDPTVAKCIRWAKKWGYNEMWMLNIFAIRSTDPKYLRMVADPIGFGNDTSISHITSKATTIVCCWGTGGEFLHRGYRVWHDLLNHSKTYCLGYTKAGHPRHPLYMSNDTSLQEFSYEL
jgi:hypothetical protein